MKKNTENSKIRIEFFEQFTRLMQLKISVSGQTCGQRRKNGLVQPPESREEQAHYVYHENARFQEILRGNKRKSDGVEKINTTSDFGLSDKT